MQTADALVGPAMRWQPEEGHIERVASAVVGGTLLTLGLRSRSLGGAAMALASGALLYQGLRGRLQRSRLRLRLTGQGEQPEPEAQPEATEVERTLTLQKPAEELHRLWRDPGTLSRVMGHFAEVTASSEDRMHWKVHGPLGGSLEWDSRMVEDRPGELLRWESLDATTLSPRGSVSFRPAPGDWGTEVTLRLDLTPPGGALGQAVMRRMHGVPRKLVDMALRRFKSLAETGEIPTVEKNPSARGRTDAV